MKKEQSKYVKYPLVKGLSLILLIFLFGSFVKEVPNKNSESLKVETHEKPNVLLISWDGMQAKRIGSYGADYMHTPSLDKLSETGFTFINHFVQQSLCRPSRYNLLTGLRPDALRIYDNNTPLLKNNPDVKTLPQLFLENGYETIKTQGMVPGNMDDELLWNKIISVKGDWVGKGYLSPKSIKEFMDYQKRNPEAPMGKGPAWDTGEVHDTAYEDGRKTMEVIRELHRLKKSNKPFFMTIGFQSTHLPFLAPKKYWDMYPPESIQLPDNFTSPENVSKYTMNQTSEINGYSNMPKDQKSVTHDQAKNIIRAYQAAISYDDALTGMILDELKSLGLDKNTIVVFWSDHGAKVGEHHGWAKQTNYEIDTNVPLIVRVPQLETAAGKMSEALIETVDIYPALAELCNLQAPNNLQGNSFVPLMFDNNLQWKEAALSQYPRSKGKVMGYSMRTKKYRYTEWITVSDGKVLDKELYDHLLDPGETINLAKDTQRYSATMDSLSVLLGERRKTSLTPGGFSSLTSWNSLR